MKKIFAGAIVGLILGIGIAVLALDTRAHNDFYRISVVDLSPEHVDRAIANCYRNNGLAGWLSQIDERGNFVGESAPYCVMKVR